MRFIFTVVYFAILTLNCLSGQNLGIETQTHEAKLHIYNPLADSSIFYTDFEDQDLSAFTISGGGGWEIALNQGFTGHGLESTDVENEDSTVLQLLVQVPVLKEGVIRFYMKLDTEDNEDFASFSIDGSEKISLSGFTAWKFYEYVVSTGTHTLEWKYKKDDNPNEGGNDIVWIDNISASFIKNYSLKIQDGTQADGKVLVSDPYGNASWEQLQANSTIARF